MLINLDLATDLVKHHLMLHKINVADCISNSLQFGSVFILYVAKKIDFKLYLNLSSPYIYLEKIKKLYEVLADKKIYEIFCFEICNLFIDLDIYFFDIPFSGICKFKIVKH